MNPISFWMSHKWNDEAADEWLESHPIEEDVFRNRFERRHNREPTLYEVRHMAKSRLGREFSP